MATFGRPKPNNPQFQRGHPLAQGMVAFAALTEYSGDRDRPAIIPTSTLFEAVQSINLQYQVASPSATVDWTGSPFGAVVNFTDTTSVSNGTTRLDFGGSSASAGSGIDVPQLALSQFSIGVIVNVTAFTKTNAFLVVRVTPGLVDPFIRYGIQADGTNAAFSGFISTGGAGTLSSACKTGTLNTNQWYALVFTGDSSGNLKMYQDSILQNTVAVGSPAGTGAGRFVVGGDPETAGFNQSLNGKVAAVTVWDRPLSQPEISQWSYDPFEVLRENTHRWLFPASAAVPIKFRRTLSTIGTKAGSRQSHV